LDRLFFGAPAQAPGPLAATIRVLRYPYAVIRDLQQGEINLRAMSLVFTTLLALIPLLALSFALLKGFHAHRALEPLVHQFFSPLGAGGDEFTDRVMQFADGVSGGIVGSVGLALLAWTLVGTIKKVEDSFNFVWRVEHARSFVRRIIEYLALIVLGPALLVGFLGLVHAALTSEPAQLAQATPLLGRLMNLGIAIAPYAMVIGLFTLVYMFTPNTHVRLRPAFIGALAAGILWAAMGKLFTGWVISTTRLTLVYAGFAVIVAGLMWTYFGWLVLLAGAQLSFYLQNPNYLQLGTAALRLSSAEREQLALNLMFLVGRAQRTGARPWTIESSANELGLPGIAVAHMAAALERPGLLKIDRKEELMLAREARWIGLQEILDAARHQHSGQLPAPRFRVPAVERLTAHLDAAWRKSCEAHTLHDLLDEPGMLQRT
jgi:membrane protein